MGLKILVVIKGLPNAVNSKGAVSPAILAMDNMTPESTPLKPQGNTIRKITL